MSLTNNDIKKIASLARIKITEEESPLIACQLNGIMDWIDQLQNVDTTSVDGQPMTAESIMREQEDIVTEFNHVEEILANAPASKHHMFMVPKMVE